MNELGSEKWLVKLFATSFIVIGLPVFGIMGFNYYIDPLWNYTHANDFNDYQLGFDERQLKQIISIAMILTMIVY